MEELEHHAEAFTTQPGPVFRFVAGDDPRACRTLGLPITGSLNPLPLLLPLRTILAHEHG
jgi:hypothetical protein